MLKPTDITIQYLKERGIPMIPFIILVSLIAGIALLITFFVFLFDYFEHVENVANRPKIKFSTFLIFYDINPSRWILNDTWVQCKIPRNDLDNNFWFHSLFDEEHFAFNYIDTLRYKHWYKKLLDNKVKQSNYKTIASMLAAVKQDIANLEAQAKREHNEAIEILRSLIK
jgi:hypothetical protein